MKEQAVGEKREGYGGLEREKRVVGDEEGKTSWEEGRVMSELTCRVCGVGMGREVVVDGEVVVLEPRMVVGGVVMDLSRSVVCEGCIARRAVGEAGEAAKQRYEDRVADGKGAKLFPLDIEKYDLEKYPEGANGEVVRWLRRWRRVDGNVMLVGEAGVGKTDLALCLVRRALKADVMAGLVKTADVFRAANAFELGAARIRGWGTMGLLVVDDLDKGDVTEKGLTALYELLDLRFNRGLRTVVTGQVVLSTPDGRGGVLGLWNRKVGNPTLADAVLDRLMPMEVFRLVGGSNRGGVRSHAPGKATKAPEVVAGVQTHWWDK